METKGKGAEIEGNRGKEGCAVLRLRWDWDSAQWHHFDSACFGAESALRCITGSIRRDEGKRCVKEHNITALPGA